MNKDLSNSEWLLTNRKGGYALGTGNLVNSRKYHGLLIASSKDLKRTHLVSSVEEKYEIMGETFFTDSNNYPDTVYPNGRNYLEHSELRPYPLFNYMVPSARGAVIILKEIFMDEDENITLIRYRNTGNQTLKYSFRYKFSLRDHHSVNRPGLFDYIPTEVRIKDTGLYRNGVIKREDNKVQAYLYTFSGNLIEDPVIYRNVYYKKEALRGYDAYEDLVSPFLHTGIFKPNECMEVMFSGCDIDDLKKNSIGSIKKGIRERYARLKRRVYHFTTGNAQHAGFLKKDYPGILKEMMNDFRINKDIVAGYPWFSAWGRDTMISLEAYTREREESGFVFSVLKSYGRELQNGVLPNVKGEGGMGANYDTVDASLWFVQRAYESFTDFSSAEKQTIYEYCKEILLNYMYNGTLPFFFDSGDGLIVLRKNTGAALTWMDAKVDNIPVTPRYGKPVEINALWYNTVRMVIEMAGELKEKVVANDTYSVNTEELNKTAALIKESMGKFYSNGILCDRLEDDRPVPEIRPNFVIALSLPFDFMDIKHLVRAYETAKNKLLTSYGLRTLSEDSPMFKGMYIGDQKTRDSAYHQGTVWAWLLLPYAKLLKKITGEKNVLYTELERITAEIKAKILDGIYASVAEIWDGKNPEESKGTPAQAWSVAALYCIEKIKENCTD
ncbi:MAG: hypothetical protein GXP33_03955 [Spirochaetes bacterium]|nr:hypothetical protein [Spirochaetota bacterium]